MSSIIKRLDFSSMTPKGKDNPAVLRRIDLVLEAFYSALAEALAENPRNADEMLSYCGAVTLATHRALIDDFAARNNKPEYRALYDDFPALNRIFISTKLITLMYQMEFSKKGKS